MVLVVCTSLAAAAAAIRHDLRSLSLLAMAAVSIVLLALLDWRRRGLTPIALRACADLALLTPLVVLIFSGRLVS
jgi:hypothetical protein